MHYVESWFVEIIIPFGAILEGENDYFISCRFQDILVELGKRGDFSLIYRGLNIWIFPCRVEKVLLSDDCDYVIADRNTLPRLFSKLYYILAKLLKYL